MSDITERQTPLDYEEMTKKAYATTMISIETTVKTNSDLIARFIEQTNKDIQIFKNEILNMKIQEGKNSVMVSEELKTVNLNMIDFSSKLEKMQIQLEDFKDNNCNPEDKPIRERIFKKERDKMKMFGGLQEASIRQTGSMIPMVIIFIILFILFNLDKIGNIMKIIFHL
jgi:hypothetical protein